MGGTSFYHVIDIPPSVVSRHSYQLPLSRRIPCSAAPAKSGRPHIRCRGRRLHARHRQTVLDAHDISLAAHHHHRATISLASSTHFLGAFRHELAHHADGIRMSASPRRQLEVKHFTRQLGSTHAVTGDDWSAHTADIYDTEREHNARISSHMTFL